MRRFSVKKNIILCSISAAVVICIAVATVLTTLFSQRISDYFNQQTSVIVNAGEPIYTSSFSTPAKVKIHDEAVCRDVEAEGIVLLENGTVTDRSGAHPSLPLAKESRITVFGQGSVDLLYGGTETDSTAADDPVTLYRALEESGFAVNPVMREFYESGAGSRYRRSIPSSSSYVRPDDLKINEVPRSEYTGTEISSFLSYSDAAVVVIGRSGTDGYDLPRSRNSSGKYYREPSAEELSMIALACEYFDNVVLLINSADPVMLGCIEDPDYAVDSVLWVGNPGSTGARAIGYVLNGYVSPSGRLTETWAYDHTSAPSCADFGASDYVWQSGSPAANSDHYTVLSEGIYVGYRYYETRYEDYATKSGNAGEYVYDETVQYPFGYGLSYTTFDYSPISVSENPETGNYDVTLLVANTGDVAGKEVVQIYMQKDYTAYDESAGIERPAVELVGFTKTDTLMPASADENYTQPVTVSVPKSSLEVYDPTAADGAGAYITEGGEYLFTAAADAHAAAENFLRYKAENGLAEVDETRVSAGYANADASAVYSLTVAEDIPEAPADGESSAETDVSSADGFVARSESSLTEPSGMFAEADIRTYDGEFRYLTRSDWEETFPSETYENGRWSAGDDVGSAMQPSTEYLAGGTVSDSPSSADDLTAFDLIAAEYGDERFIQLANMLSRTEKADFVRMGGNTISALGGPVVPETRCREGLTGVSTAINVYSPVTSYPTPAVIAATWNTELAYSVGECFSEDALASEVSGIFAPCLNVRRNPFGGGNYKSFGEDPLVIGEMGSAQVHGIRTKMCFAFIGDFALAMQEDEAVGLSVYGSEQTFRQIYLRPFEIVVKGGGATAVIQSASRIGTVWVGAHKGLMTDVLRGEWGFEGMTLTASEGNDAYMDVASGLVAGTDMWFNNVYTSYMLSAAQLNSADVSEALTRATSNVIYTVVSSNSMNGITAETRVEYMMPVWQRIYIVLASVVLLAALSLPVIVLVNRIVTKKKDHTSSFTTVTWT